MPAATDPRAIALRVLLEVDRGRAFADAALGRRIEKDPPLSPEDRRLATILVYGPLARQATLDYFTEALAGRAVLRLDRATRVLLRLGLFQLGFLDRVPDYAAVDTTVELARRAAPRAGGLINAVLRRFAREGAPELPQDPGQRLLVEFSHPLWMIDRFLEEFGDEEGRALLQANNEPMPTVLRALCAREKVLAELCRQGLRARAAKYAPDAVRCELPRTIPGLALPQGEASQLVTLLAEAEAGQRVLDACAAPGGKSAYLAALVGPAGRVVAVDPARGARRRVARCAANAGVENVRFVASSMEALRSAEEFDLVFVDAPCSGLGTLREHPEIRWRRSADDIRALASRQRAILTAAARRLRRGGRLVYSTCTLLREENDDVVEAFLREHREFREIVRAPRHPALRDFVGGDGRFRSLPQRHDTGGYFGARLERR